MPHPHCALAGRVVLPGPSQVTWLSLVADLGRLSRLALLLWLTAGFHVGHQNIARYAGRPFPHDPAGAALMGGRQPRPLLARSRAPGGRLDGAVPGGGIRPGVLPGSALAGPPTRLDLAGHQVLVSHFPYAGNVGVDAWGGVPVAQTRLAELIKAGPQDREVLHWP